MFPLLTKEISEKKFGAEVYLCKYCNMRCRYCGRFSNVICKSEDTIYEYDKLIKDLKYLNSLNILNRISFSGGEPLLYPRITELLYEVRSFFKGSISIFTNCKKFKSMGIKFYRAMSECNVNLDFTPYKNINHNFIRTICKLHKINWCNASQFTSNVEVFSGDRLAEPKTEIQKDINDKYYNVCLCNTLTLFNGEIYSCGQRCNAPDLLKLCPHNFELKDTDKLKIQDIKNSADIIEFMKTPKDFCKYCFNCESIQHNWSIGDGKPEDWFEN